MRILRIGGFDKMGNLDKWIINGEDVGQKADSAVSLLEDGRVLIGGVEVVPLSNLRQQAMGM